MVGTLLCFRDTVQLLRNPPCFWIHLGCFVHQRGEALVLPSHLKETIIPHLVLMRHFSTLTEMAASESLLCALT